jgi:hypothetical protein
LNLPVPQRHNEDTVIDATWIDDWAKRYDKDYDAELLNEIAPRVGERGYYDRQDLLAVGRWKAKGRTQSRLKANTDSEIRDITRMALEAALPYQHRILTLLKGVKVPTATALLMVWDKNRHTVIDVNAVKALFEHSEINTQTPSYMEYLAVCQEISRRCERSLRTVDQALYEYGRQH